MTHKTFAYNIKILEFFYIYYMNEYNENDATHKSEINATMAFTQSLRAKQAATLQK